mgnify:CR=1 FL=1
MFYKLWFFWFVTWKSLQCPAKALDWQICISGCQFRDQLYFECTEPLYIIYTWKERKIIMIPHHDKRHLSGCQRRNMFYPLLHFHSSISIPYLFHLLKFIKAFILFQYSPLIEKLNSLNLSSEELEKVESNIQRVSRLWWYIKWKRKMKDKYMKC